MVVVFSLLSLGLTISTIRLRIIEEAQNRVCLNMGSAWSVLDNRLADIDTVVRLVALKDSVVSTFDNGRWDDVDLKGRLEKIRLSSGLDFLDVVSAQGKVLLRTTPPYAAGDDLGCEHVVAAALKGEAKSAMALACRARLEKESECLPDRAFLQVETTPRSRMSPKKEESRGMLMVAAAPVWHANHVIGVIYGGVLVNRNSELIDRIHEVVYKDEKYRGQPVGTATIFLDDTRIATTVRFDNGNRALGSRVSKEVADSVLDNGKPWTGKAFVVRDWYLTAYDPIRDGSGKTIGMLYVGVLKKPYDDYGHSLVWRYVLVSALVLLVGLGLAFITANRLARPIHSLVEASNRVSNGAAPSKVQQDGTSHETDRLIESFNQMTATLQDREDKLKALNRSYMETLGFVSHELKSPVATIMNYVYLLREQKMGPLNEKQLRAIRAIDSGSARLVEMVRHYLNLSRIENNELMPVRGRVAVAEEVIAPLLETMDAEIQHRHMKVCMNVGGDTVLDADRNMVREVFENLVSNAVKYGRDGGMIEISAAREDTFVKFMVRNEGAGIPEHMLTQMFQKFARVEGTDKTKTQKGTGLGLFITKYIVEAHGGVVSVVSKAGEWTEFSFTLPSAGAEVA